MVQTPCQSDLLVWCNEKDFNKVEWSRIDVGIGCPDHTDSLVGEESKVLRFCIPDNLQDQMLSHLKIFGFRTYISVRGGEQRYKDVEKNYSRNGDPSNDH